MTEDPAAHASVSLAPTKPGVRGRLLNLIMRSYFKRHAAKLALSDAAIAAVRQRLEWLSKHGAKRSVGVTIRTDKIANVPVEIVEPDQPASDTVTIVYIHGGAFLAGSPRTHRGITRYLARSVNARVVVPDYRLAPEHIYPAGLADVVAVYAACVADQSASRIAIAGDSAGGNLVVSAMLQIREAGLELPAAAVAISPWTDLTGSGDSITTQSKNDAMLPAAKLGQTAKLYAGEVDLRTPTISPLFGDLAGLPPLLVHVGTHEILLDDSRRLVERANAAGVAAQLRLWGNLPHVFHAFADYLPAARVALDEIALFLRQRVAGESAAANPA